MKRGGPPARRTPLRRTSFKRTPSVRRRPGVTKSKIPARVREAVERRARGLCEVRANSRCEGRGYHCHHRLLRSAGGPHTEENLLLVCASCHQWIHHHTAFSYERGWLLRRSA